MNAHKQMLPFSHPGFEGQIGLARADITPPVGIYARNWGAAKHDCAESIHRPLTLTAMVLADPETNQRLVFIEGDLSWWRSLDAWKSFQTRLLEATDLSEESLIFSVTHTHAAPPLMESNPELPGGEMLGPWLESVLMHSIELVKTATSNCEPSALEWHYGSCQLAQTRDLSDPADKSSRKVCGFNPHQQADTTLLVGRVSDAAGTTRAVLANYACHPTTLAFDNRAISPDFVGAMRETIEKETGGLAMFLQGASGELSPRHQYVGQASVADRHGEQLGYSVLATLADMEPPRTQLVFTEVVESGAPLAMWKHKPRTLSGIIKSKTESISVPLKDWPSAKSLEQAASQCEDRTEKERLKRKLAIRRALGDGDRYELPFWFWQTGQTLWVGSMAESYSILQQKLRQQFPDLAVICLNLINGSIGYLPPASCYDEDIYQVWQTPFDRGSLEATIEGTAHILERISRT